MKKGLLFFFAFLLSVSLFAEEIPNAGDSSVGEASVSVDEAFSASLMNKPSKKELFLRARDVLKASLENKDVSKAAVALAYLQKNVKEGAPLTMFEEYLSNMEIGEYETAVNLYASLRRSFLDSSYVMEKESRNGVEDALHDYLYRNFKEKFTKEKADSMDAIVQASDIKQESKDLYSTLLYSELVLSVNFFSYQNRTLSYTSLSEDTTCAEAFLQRAKNYVERNSFTEHTDYLKNQTIPYVEKRMQKLRDFRENPWKHKYYTGGIGVFLGKWTGFMAGDAMDFLHAKMGDSFMLEVSMQFSRISANIFFDYGFVTEPDGYSDYYGTATEDERAGVTLGFTAFDSRFLKVEPFFGIGGMTMMNCDDTEIDPMWLLGANIDLRLFATKPSRIGGMSVAFIVRLKYMAGFGTFSYSYSMYDDDGYAGDFEYEDGLIAQTFGVSLGISLW